MNPALPVPDALSRHHTRRLDGTPTVSALVGPAGLGVRAWGGWANGDRRPFVVGVGADPAVFLPDWVAAAFAADPPTGRAARWLAAVAGRECDTPRMTRHDLDLLWQALPLDPAGPAAAAARLILNDLADGVPTEPGRFVREAGTADRAARAVADLYPPGLWPALLLVPPTPAGDDWGYAAARVLERVVAAEPGLPVGVSLSADAYARLLDRHPTARAVALLREGLVELRGVSPNELEARFRAAGIDPPPPAAARLAAEGLAEEAAAAFVSAARAVRQPTQADLASDFRSVHEGFLFELLESMPATAGLFRPNRPLPFRHGPKAAEADLLAEPLRLAVEVDGGYYHLDPDQYRRDRRKDWLYQRHGYLVLRFLAEDIATDPGPALDTILEAVSRRRAPAPPTGAA